MKTFSQFKEENNGLFFWSCDAGKIDGLPCLDAIAYDSEEDMENDEDNSLAVERETVIDDDSVRSELEKYPCTDCGEVEVIETDDVPMGRCKCSDRPWSLINVSR